MGNKRHLFSTALPRRAVDTAFGASHDEKTPGLSCTRTLGEPEEESQRWITLTNGDVSKHVRYLASRMSPLEAAVRRGLWAVNAQMAGGANPNERFVGGNTALHVAASLGRDEIVMALVGSGGDVDARDSMGETPLVKAVRFGHVVVAEMLIKFRCKVGVRAWGPRSYSALDTAAETG